MSKEIKIKNHNGCSSELDKTAIKEIISSVPKRRQDLLKWYGWGYQDSYFSSDKGQIVFNGNR